MKITDKKYAFYQAEIKKQIATLQAELENHKVDAPNYGHIGDLAEISSQLAQSISFLKGEDE